MEKVTVGFAGAQVDLNPHQIDAALFAFKSPLSRGALLADEVGLCTAFRARTDRYPNLTVKKIPRSALARCERGHDDYSLRVENLPQAPPPKGKMDLFAEEPD